MGRYAIGDIHGCSKTFKKLVEDSLHLSTEDELFLLGDLVNKGPDSKGVLDYVFQLIKEGFRVKCAKGNHDQMFLDAYYGKYSDYWKTAHAEPKTLKSFGVKGVEEISIKYFYFIKDMPYFLELDNCFLVHAGFNFALDNLFVDFRAMLYSRKYVVKPEKLGFKRLIHGHVPIEIKDIEASVAKNSYEINLDGGCVYYLNEGLGNLIALDLDLMQLYRQPNIDVPYSIDIKRP